MIIREIFNQIIHSTIFLSVYDSEMASNFSFLPDSLSVPLVTRPV